jgi:hypothetical protein
MPETNSLSHHFHQLEDPRIARSKRHSLHDILIVSICALLCGAEGFVDMEEFGKAQREWLGQLLELPNGIPSHDTFGRVFALLDPEQFAEAFSAWTQSLRRALPGEVVALDGKTLRRSGGGSRSPVHLVSAWAADNRLVLGQLRTAQKSNEITAVPELLRRLELAGCPSAPLRALSLSKRHRHPRRDGLPESHSARDQRGGRRLRARPQSQPRHPAWGDQNLPR